MAPYAERIVEPYDLTPLAQEVIGQNAFNREDTPSPRSPESSTSPTPPMYELLVDTRPLAPLLSTGDGIPYDHTLPEYIRQVSGQASFEDISRMTLRVLTQTASLQQMSLYTPNLEELNLEGSVLTSLRDIGCELRSLHVLKVARCRLTSLDGTMGLTSLQELYAAGNVITSAAPCAHLSNLHLLDLARNQLYDSRSFGFLSVCKHLKSLYLSGNPVIHEHGLREHLVNTLPALQFLDQQPLRQRDVPANVNHQVLEAVSHLALSSSPIVFEKGESTESNSSRVSSASSSTSSNRRDSDIGIGKHVDELETPGPSTETVVSKLTSGQVLYGNLAVCRRKQLTSVDQQESTDALEASRRWRAAYHKFRAINATRWESEPENAEEDITGIRSIENKVAKEDEEQEI